MALIYTPTPAAATRRKEHDMDPMTTVEDFLNERQQYITAIENCSPENTADYWRWQGHAEARRQLAERLT